MDGITMSRKSGVKGGIGVATERLEEEKASAAAEVEEF